MNMKQTNDLCSIFTLWLFFCFSCSCLQLFSRLGLRAKMEFLFKLPNETSIFHFLRYAWFSIFIQTDTHMHTHLWQVTDHCLPVK